MDHMKKRHILNALQFIHTVHKSSEHICLNRAEEYFSTEGGGSNISHHLWEDFSPSCDNISIIGMTYPI
jgi:hypothetical protein